MPTMTGTRMITAPDEAILCALHRFSYLTSEQAGRLLYPKARDSARYVRERLRPLVKDEYVLRLGALPKPSTGGAPFVFTLGRRGRQYLATCGIEVEPYYRPSEEQEKARNNPYMFHTLAAIDVLISAELLCRDDDRLSCPRMLNERELKRKAVRVELPNREGASERRSKRAVIPDGWFELEVAGDEVPTSIALELDRGTEGPKHWRDKVAALVAWIDGPYNTLFATDNITVAVVTGTDRRRDVMRLWTNAELNALQRGDLAGIFLFTSANPVTTPPRSFFFDDLWYPCIPGRPVSVMGSFPEAGEGEVFVSR